MHCFRLHHEYQMIFPTSVKLFWQFSKIRLYEFFTININLYKILCSDKVDLGHTNDTNNTQDCPPLLSLLLAVESVVNYAPNLHWPPVQCDKHHYYATRMILIRHMQPLLAHLSLLPRSLSSHHLLTLTLTTTHIHRQHCHSAALSKAGKFGYLPLLRIKFAGKHLLQLFADVCNLTMI